MDLDTIKFANTDLVIIREKQVRENLSLDLAIEDLRAALKDLGNQLANNCPRVRVESQQRDLAWLHTLRGGWKARGVAGGKDYTSKKFDTLAMWVTVVNTTTGLPIALIEADYLSRIRTAAVTAIATDLLAPERVRCLAHFGAGKISEFLIKAVLKVRPSLHQVLLVRKHKDYGVPTWLNEIDKTITIELGDVADALREAEIITTATSSIKPVIPPRARMPNARHLNLIGSNHLERREIHNALASRCLPPRGYLVVDDANQAEIEAGDFFKLSKSGVLNWKRVPTLGQLLVDDTKRVKARRAELTAFKSLGIGLMDLAVAEGVLRRFGVVPSQT